MKTKIRKNRTGIIGIVAVIACAIVLISAPAFATIVLELHSDTTDGSATFIDSSNPARIITTVGGAHHSTADLDNFGGSSTSMSFNGAGDYLRIPDSTDWDFGSGDFTIDLWVYFTAVGGSYLLGGAGDSGGPATAWKLEYEHSNTTLTFYGRDSSTFTVAKSETWSPLGNKWYHVALTKDSSDDIRMFVDGSEIGSTTNDSSPINSSAELRVGSAPNYSTYDISGYLDDVYIRKGEALEGYQIDLIVDFGGEEFEADRTQRRLDMASGLNDGGVNQLSLGYTQEEISQLADLYEDGNGGLSPADVAIGVDTWSYVDGDLPGDTGFSIGDAYMYGGKWYIKLGSGLEGVPEVPNGPALLIAMVFVVCAGIRKRLVPDGGHRFTGLDV